MKKLTLLLFLIFIKLNLCFASMVSLPNDIKHIIYDTTPIIIRGEVIEISRLSRRDRFDEEPTKKIQQVINKLYKEQGFSESTPHMFLITKVKIKEILKNASSVSLNIGDEIYTTFIVYKSVLEPLPRKDTDCWLFLNTSDTSTIKQVTECFMRLKSYSVTDSPIEAPPETLYFNGSGIFSFWDFIEDSPLTEALRIIYQVYQIEDIEEQILEWQKAQAKHKDNPFLQNEWEEPNMAEDFY